MRLNKDSTPHNTKPDQDTEDADHERIQDELEDATGCITDTIKRFLAQGVAHHLPISAYVPHQNRIYLHSDRPILRKEYSVPLIAHPLLLSALDVRLASTKSQSATRKRRFRYYANLMQVFQQRYDGTDTVAAFIQQTLQLAGYILPRPQARGLPSGSDQSAAGSPSSGKCSSWSELFADFPKLYLRLLFALDYALSRGYFPSYGGVQGFLGGDDIHIKGDDGAGEIGSIQHSISDGIPGSGVRASTSSPYMAFASGSGSDGHAPTNLYTLLDSEQQQQQQQNSQQNFPAEPYTVPYCETQALDPLVIPTYNPMLDSEYTYPGHLPFTQQNYDCGVHQLRESGMLDANGSPDFLSLGSSSSESYSDIVALPVGVGEEGCV